MTHNGLISVAGKSVLLYIRVFVLTHLTLSGDLLVFSPPDPVSERCISLAVPWSSGVRCAWVFGDLCPLHVFTRPSAHMLWMFSRCMAEMEKHNGK